MISSVSSAVLCIVQVTHFQLAHTHINLWALPTPDLAVLQHLPHCSAICPGKHSPWDCQSCCVPWQAALTLCRKAWCVAGGCPWCSILLKDSCRAVFSYSHVFWRAHCCTSALPAQALCSWLWAAPRHFRRMAEKAQRASLEDCSPRAISHI